MDRARTSQFSAVDASTANSTARLFSTGRAPGSPRHVGQTCVFGADPNCVRHPQKALVVVRSCTCTSSPITGSYFANAAVPADVDAAVAVISAGVPPLFSSGFSCPDGGIVLSPGPPGGAPPA